jgi:hypothetical protein
MLFTGGELSDVLRRSASEIELRNEHGRACEVISRDRALAIDPDLFVGVGNRRRIRFLRPRITKTIFNAGSQTTQRMKDGCGRNISHPLIREHRPTGGR